jgi:hypothetical protein
MILFDLKDAVREGDPPAEEQCEPFRAELAASRIFAEVKPLETQLARITNSAELLQQVSELVEVLAPLGAFHAKIKDLTKLIEPMLAFRDRIRNVAPFEILENELVELSAAFGVSLTQLAASLDAAILVQDRLAHLAAEFEPAKTLNHDFSALARSFERTAQR